MAAVTPVALDHNFPEPLLRDVARWMPEFAFHWIKNLPPHDLNRLEDHDLVYELHRRAFPVMATNNHKTRVPLFSVGFRPPTCRCVWSVAGVPSFEGADGVEAEGVQVAGEVS